ncbi:MAG: chemotaxis protein CheA [bacterium]
MSDSDMLEAFKSEFDDISDDIEEVATKFYDNPNVDDLDHSYRLMHTLKGNCYTAGFEGMGNLVHTFEDVLGELKENNRSPSAEVGDLLLEVNDQLNQMIQEDPESDPPEQLLESIESILEENETKDDTETTSDSSDSSSQSGTSSTEVEIQEIPVSIEKLDELFRKSENLRAELLDRGERGLMQEAGKISRSLLDIRLIRPKTIIPKLKRLVRSTTSELDDKSIDFHVSGETNQASASVIEDLSKILPHLLKNSIDHGIESESVREENGKDPTGTVELSFEKVASSFVVKVSDDGAGLDADSIAESAVEKGVIDESELGQMTNYEKLKLIFEPGFSTTEDVSEVSGRGVGMDAVATTVREYGGRVEIETELSEGTTFELHFPVPFQWDEFLLAKIGSRKLGFPIRFIDAVHCLEDQLKPENGMIMTDDQAYPMVGFDEIDPRFGDPIERPAVILDLAMPVSLAVDELLGFTGTLILSPPSQTRETYISGIGRDSTGENFWGINLKDVSRNVNAYMVGT